MHARKKTYLLPQKLINTAKSVFRVKTETGAIIRALEEVALKKELASLHHAYKGRFKIKSLYGR